MQEIRSRYNLSSWGLEPSVVRVLQTELDEVLKFTTVIQQTMHELVEYRALVESSGRRNEFLDQKAALALATEAEGLLEHALQNPWTEEVPVIIAAVRYLIRTDDAHSDFEGFDGLDDDRAVIEAIQKKYLFKE